MYLQWQTQYVKNNESPDFVFNGKVYAYAAGFSSFTLIYPLGGNSSYSIQEMGMALSPQKFGDDTVNVTLNIHLDDGQGNSFDPDLSGAYVTVLAWVGEDASGAAFIGMTPDLSQGERGISLGNDSAPFAGAFLSSFTLQSQNALKVKEIQGKVVATPVQGGINTSGSMSINNGSGLQILPQNLIAGIIAPLDSQPEFEIQLATFNNPDNGKTGVPVTFTNNVTNAIALIQSFDLVFTSPAGLSGIVAGLQLDVNGVPRIVIDSTNKNKVTVYDNTAMFDLNGNTAVTTNNLKLLVIATTG